MTNRTRSAVLSGLLVLGFVAAAAGSAVAILLYTPWGHERVCSLLNRAVSKGIRGRLEVARIDRLSLSQVTASDIKIIAPSGVPAIEAKHAVIDFSLSKLWAGEFGWSRADIEDCRVRVSEEKDGKVNMEQTFEKPKTAGEKSKSKSADTQPPRVDLDLQSMVTSRCLLTIEGVGLAEPLRLKDLQGIMRVQVLSNGDTELHFDQYKGSIDKGLPTGKLDFHNVSGEVTTGGKRLLHFDGAGETRSAPVAFKLDIHTKPKKLVEIGARFVKREPGALSTVVASLWSKFSPTVDIDVSFDEHALDEHAREEQAERGATAPRAQ